MRTAAHVEQHTNVKIEIAVTEKNDALKIRYGGDPEPLGPVTNRTAMLMLDSFLRGYSSRREGGGRDDE